MIKPYSFKKYKFTIEGNTIIAQSTFGRKPVVGKAKCHPDDEFDLEYGKTLAAARCNAKIAKKRNRKAIERYFAAEQGLNKAKYEMQEAVSYFMESSDLLEKAENLIDALNKAANGIEEKTNELFV